MKRFLFALIGITAISLSTGCCGLQWPYWGGGYGYPGGGCSGGACGPNSGGVYQPPPQSSFYQGNSAVQQSVQMGVPQPIQGPVTNVPAGYTYQTRRPILHTARMPFEPLPTF